MNKLVSSASAAALLCVMSVAGSIPAAAANRNFQKQDQHIGNFCQQNPQANNCNDWQMNHNRWSNRQYQGFYRSHQRDRDFGGNGVAALFGFVAGAAVASSFNNGDDPVQACASRYRSYDLNSDTFLGYDGYRHDCLL